MEKKKVYIVSLISRSIQTKLVYAGDKKEAIVIANKTDWEGKEEMLESKTKAREAILNGNQKEGDYPDFYDSDYVFTDDDCVRYNELNK